LDSSPCLSISSNQIDVDSSSYRLMDLDSSPSQSISNR
jgi:hypothetical protein